MDFPIFNVADICVCVGAAILFIYLSFFDKLIFPPDDKKKKEKAEVSGEEEKND